MVIMALRIPTVLLHLWEELVSRELSEGLESEGIFRLSARLRTRYKPSSKCSENGKGVMAWPARAASALPL